MGAETQMEFVIGAVTDVGITREINQDSFCAMKLDTSMGQMAFAIVCDGMGGFSEGELASATVMDGFRRWVLKELPALCTEPVQDYRIREEWDRLISNLNYKVHTYGVKKNLHLGTTATVLLVTQNRYFVLNIGDSRTYLIQTFATQLTEDHSVVFSEYLAGKISREEMATDTRNNVLTRSIGVEECIHADYFFGDVLSDMTFFLCSDGGHHKLTEQELAFYLMPGRLEDTGMIRERLEYLTETVKQREEEDNITMVAIVAQGR